MTNERNSQQQEMEFRALLQREFPSLQNAALQRDLWPRMLRRLDAQPERLSIPWFDWVLAAAVATALLLFPNAIPALLYQL